MSRYLFLFSLSQWWFQNRRRRARQIGSRAATSTLETNRQHSRSSPYAFRQRQHCVTAALGNAGSDASDRPFCERLIDICWSS
jgi:hypothetical protein